TQSARLDQERIPKAIECLMSALGHHGEDLRPKLLHRDFESPERPSCALRIAGGIPHWTHLDRRDRLGRIAEREARGTQRRVPVFWVEIENRGETRDKSIERKLTVRPVPENLGARELPGELDLRPHDERVERERERDEPLETRQIDGTF